MSIREKARFVNRFTAKNVKNAGDTIAYRMNESDWKNISTGDLLHISVKNSGKDAYICDTNGNKIADLYPDK